ncbi:MAG: Ferric iron ABC transporter, ATP-binding protein [Candidatus Carbobacillus altaicus]|uniref:Ferric iron ABC transporter, ATP-binding protein n=1 Tax=Candidatus Carbonibacillus altaicus TaxID=2163959 RepID=A0A2R6XZK7_9BACL|nr:MAG: Ferric iron ABC transporter, ATP-binding protein [Candidatus Carbobacillus altaicus]
MMQVNAQPHLVIESLTFRYPGQRTPLLDDFHLSLNKGERVALLGPSGRGKTTLLRLIAGLEKPDAGRIILDGRVLTDGQTIIPPEARRIGMVFQDYALFPHLTVLENVTFGLFRLPRHERQKRAEDVLALVQMTHYAHRYPHELSGGEQQRVALARTIAPKPELILLDEPLSNLDPALRDELRAALRILLDKEQMTALIVTHDEGDAQAISDRKVQFNDQGSP